MWWLLRYIGGLFYGTRLRTWTGSEGWGPRVRAPLLDHFQNWKIALLPRVWCPSCWRRSLEIQDRVEFVCSLLKSGSAKNLEPRVLVPSWLRPLPKDFSLSLPNVAGDLRNFRSDYCRSAATNFRTDFSLGNIRRNLNVGILLKGWNWFLGG